MSAKRNKVIGYLYDVDKESDAEPLKLLCPACSDKTQTGEYPVQILREQDDMAKELAGSDGLKCDECGEDLI